MPILDKILEPVADIIEKVVPDADLKRKLRFELETLDSKQLHEIALAQIDLNKQEAKGNWFQAGWRPLIGYICALGLFFNVIAHPIASIWLTLPPVDASLLYPVMMSLLGLGALRTVEKVK